MPVGPVLTGRNYGLSGEVEERGRQDEVGKAPGGTSDNWIAARVDQFNA